ncbi:ribonuclease HII [Tepidimonas taiwanensis]|uniref:Ribonuclease HII n=1 Tax=Tepidimonas taiwanensis TaxID=307486 RepID=A0A554X9A2_9BURK|nr:ribonuclease HII [Tepidimonas taiwanensis]MDM7463029.1 ribonuclease HII [Tepidimonas taiwanensis]TSE32412.1 Ribonuclease HII [Tepidimonas taiwanensis]UBQ06589.1 ribonuclease HII [Tepidimonas taiwanensis]
MSRRAVRAPAVARQCAFDWGDGGLVAGVDEAGRGPLAGPVVAAAVILDDAQPIDGLADSKTLSPARRELLYEAIRARALCVGVGTASVEEIDRLNILQATLTAMQRAVAALRLRPSLVLVDGNRLPVLPVRAEAVVRGDATVDAIAAASIVAKVTRDRLMDEAHAAHPAYGFDRHRGYGTAQHLAAIRQYGPTPWHRRSFGPVAQALLAHGGSVA